MHKIQSDLYKDYDMVTYGGNKKLESGRSDMFSHFLDLSILGTAKDF